MKFADFLLNIPRYISFGFGFGINVFCNQMLYEKVMLNGMSILKFSEIYGFFVFISYYFGFLWFYGSRLNPFKKVNIK